VISQLEVKFPIASLIASRRRCQYLSVCCSKPTVPAPLAVSSEHLLADLQLQVVRALVYPSTAMSWVSTHRMKTTTSSSRGRGDEIARVSLPLSEASLKHAGKHIPHLIGVTFVRRDVTFIDDHRRP